MATTTIHSSNSFEQVHAVPAQKTVVVVGAGIAGLGAARDLARHPGVRVILLEARNRLGGRLDTRHGVIQIPAGAATVQASETKPRPSAPDLSLGTDIPIDLGASWIHGADDSNPLMDLIKATQTRIVPTNTDAVYLAPGEEAVESSEGDHYWSVVWEIFEEALEYAKEHRDSIPDDMSFKQWLDDYFASRQTTNPTGDRYMTKRDLEIVPLFTLYWADENAIPLDQVALKYLDAEDMYPGDHCIMADGYDVLMRAIVKDMHNVNIHLENIVTRIEYSANRATVWTNRSSFTADAVLVTLPLGVLKDRKVAFVPPLPLRKQEAIARLGFGTMYKIVLAFERCFWPTDKHFLNFMATDKTQVDPKLTSHLNPQQLHILKTYMKELPNYSSLMPVHDAPILIGYATNAVADMLEELSDKEMEEVFMAHLSHYYPCIVTTPEEHRPVQTLVTRWRADPFACGSYTSIPIGSNPTDLEQFEIPIYATSRFAVTRQQQATNGQVIDHVTGTNSTISIQPTSSINHNCTPAIQAATTILETNIAMNGVKSQRDASSMRRNSLIGMDASHAEEGVVFFAGEHTTATHFASLHGAYLTGQREAAKILKRLCGLTEE
ncbi:hypothetical protein BGW42_001484 [Actinomortierella wolfii]|nr:hypothetical protein BGW42_001484 [Actinomortierella wolfii]